MLCRTTDRVLLVGSYALVVATDEGPDDPVAVTVIKRGPSLTRRTSHVEIRVT